MSTAKLHNEWLSLIDISGPFLSLPVLMRVFPQGLEAHDADASREARLAHEEWLDNQQGLRPEPAMHTLWVRYVLERLSGFSNETIAEGLTMPPTVRVTFAEHGETLQPDLVVHEPGNPAKPRVLVQVYPSTQKLDKTVPEKRWKTSPAMRMMELLRATGVRLGLVTNGEEWMLVDAPRSETSAFISWYASLWFEEPLTLRSFRSLLSARRFFSVQDKETLEGMLADSVNEQQEVTDQLGYQVRRAVEVLIQSIDRADQDRGRQLLEGINESELYEAALTVMMRLVFLFSAEERGLLLLGDPLYDQYYAVSTLRAQLREIADQHGEEVLERRFDAWCRLLATFRAVYGGIQHDRLRLPAYGGSLFDPNRFPFLEGRSQNLASSEEETPLPINNRTVLHLLEALQILRMPMSGGGKEPRRLSFRSLDVEQIGHVYEGLLDHAAVRATETVLGLVGSRDSEPEIGLSRLVAEQAKGLESFVKYLAENTRRSENAIKRSLSAELDSFQIQHLKSACGNDTKIYQQVLAFAGVVREDDFGMPVVILPGNVYVTAGVTRRATGTHYTPRSLTEPIVQHTLGPLVYIGPAEGLPREEWKLRTPAEILSLKVCDMAMGSAGFLVQADRYLAERLMEAWAIASEGGIQITPDGELSRGLPGETLLPKDEDERMILARRLVADRCLYGVDKNPLAVEIAKLSLWLTTMAKGRPFSFLDHALKCGDSLVGASADDYLRWAQGWREPKATLFDEQLIISLDTARQKRRELESFEVKDVRDTEHKAELLKEADAAMERIKRGCDLLTGVRLLGLSDRDIEELQLSLLFPYMAGEFDGEIDASKHPNVARALNAAIKERAFHWEFEFPEVFEKGGFSAFVGNPPFMGNRLWAENIGEYFQDWAEYLLNRKTGRTDLCALFFFRTHSLTRKDGFVGLIGAESLREGDTRLIGLAPIAKNGKIYRSIRSLRWPGKATVRVCVVWFTNYPAQILSYLDDEQVHGIDEFLSKLTFDISDPHTLVTGLSGGKGSDNSKGDVLILSTGGKWLSKLLTEKSPYCRQYLTADDLTSHGFRECDRWVVDTQKDSLEEIAIKSPVTHEFLLEVVKPVRTVEFLEKLDGLANQWWQLWRPREELYSKLRESESCLVMPVVSKYLLLKRVPTDWVFTNKFILIEENNPDLLIILSTNFSDAWFRRFSGSLGETLSVSITKAFNTYPLPSSGVTNGEKIMGDFENLRTTIITKYEIGFTEMYNRFHNPKEGAEDIVRLRELHVEMDNAVASAYGWDDLELGHGFHETAQGIRYTISESARREVLSMLLKLNHERWEEEQKQAALEGEEPKSKGGKKAKRSKPSDGQMGLL